MNKSTKSHTANHIGTKHGKEKVPVIPTTLLEAQAKVIVTNKQSHFEYIRPYTSWIN